MLTKSKFKVVIYLFSKLHRTYYTNDRTQAFKWLNDISFQQSSIIYELLNDKFVPFATIKKRGIYK